jgi:hypothetical protein
MTCEKIKPDLRFYFEDLLPESSREPIREHLKDCGSCRDYSFAFSGFGTDLRRLATLEPPAALLEKVAEEYQKPVAPAALTASEPQKMSKGWIAAAMIFLIIGLGVWAGSRTSWPKKQAMPPEPVQTAAPAETPAAATEGEPVPSGAFTKPLSSARFDIALKPFHWDVEFSTLEKRNMFLAGLRQRYGTLAAHFESPSFVVFSASQVGLKDLLKLLMELGAGVKGGGAIPSYIPDYPGSVRISLALGTPQSRISRSLSHHWHLKFDLPNRFTFKERLREAGANSLYEAPEIWVLEVEGEEFEIMQDLIRSTHGLSTNIGAEQFLKTKSFDKIPLRIAVYIDEG